MSLTDAIREMSHRSRVPIAEAARRLGKTRQWLYRVAARGEDAKMGDVGLIAQAFGYTLRTDLRREPVEFEIEGATLEARRPPAKRGMP